MGVVFPSRGWKSFCFSHNRNTLIFVFCFGRIFLFLIDNRPSFKCNTSKNRTHNGKVHSAKKYEPLKNNGLCAAGLFTGPAVWRSATWPAQGYSIAAVA